MYKYLSDISYALKTFSWLQNKHSESITCRECESITLERDRNIRKCYFKTGH